MVVPVKRGSPSTAGIGTPTPLGRDPRLEAAGFNATGVLRARDYDELVPAAWKSKALLPGARSVLVLGCGGRAFGDAFEASPEARSARERDPIDRFTTRVVEEAIGDLTRRGISARALFYWQQHENQFADFVALGHACGLGSHSRLGVLLHPVFGPWISLRALVLTSDALDPTPPLPGPAACVGCPAPCATACPGAALANDSPFQSGGTGGAGEADGPDRPDGVGFDLGKCSRTTLSLDLCQRSCSARRACIIGGEHAYRPKMEQRFRSAVVRLLEKPAG